jgi:hypothetical protein
MLDHLEKYGIVYLQLIEEGEGSVTGFLISTVIPGLPQTCVGPFFYHFLLHSS